jgi:hypothetical protein
MPGQRLRSHRRLESFIDSHGSHSLLLPAQFDGQTAPPEKSFTSQIDTLFPMRHPVVSQRCLAPFRASLFPFGSTPFHDTVF